VFFPSLRIGESQASRIRDLSPFCSLLPHVVGGRWGESLSLKTGPHGVLSTTPRAADGGGKKEENRGAGVKRTFFFAPFHNHRGGGGRGKKDPPLKGTSRGEREVFPPYSLQYVGGGGKRGGGLPCLFSRFWRRESNLFFSAF